jgi:hypothetical protein
LQLEQLETRLTPAALNPYVVTTTADDPNIPIQGQVTLRDAITSANTSNNQTITFASGVSGNIQLQTALPALATNITIDGPTSGNAYIDVLGSGSQAQNPFRVFAINAGTICALNNLGIAGGYVNSSIGAGILNSGDLTLDNDQIFNNQAAKALSFGGGIFNAKGAELLLDSTTVTENSAVQGGGIDNEGSLAVNDSMILSNTGSDGGGLYNVGKATISGNTQISFNNAYAGGGIYNGSQATMSGGSVSGNMAQYGGGIYNAGGSLTLTAGVGIGDNQAADEGGGLYLNSTSTTTFNGCTIDGNQAALGVGYYEQNGATINPLAINNPDGFARGN